MRRSVFIALFALCAALIPTAPAVAAAPDLVVGAPSLWATQVEPGWAVAGTARVSNTGGGASKASQTRFYLSTDTKKSASDVVLGSSKTRRIKPKKSTTVSGGGVVASSVPLGDYYFIACADQPSRNRERSEKNNCKASSSTVSVVAPTSPNPLNVQAVLDPTKAVTTSVGTEGGTVTTQAGNGTTFTLQIPKDALALDVDITMTPVTAVPGLPTTGGLVGAVHLAPEGLLLYKMATLRIDPGDGTTADDAVGFGAEGTGTDLYLDYTRLGDTIVLDLSSFSTHGVGSGQPVPSERVPSEAEGIARERTAAELATQRAADFAVIDTDPLVPIAQDWYNRSVLPGLMDGATGGAEVNFDAVISDYFAWLKYIDTFDLEGSFGRQLDLARGLLEQTVFAAINEAARKCVANNDPAQITEIIKNAAILDAGWTDYNWDGIGIIEEWMAKCVRFELKFETQLSQDMFGGGQYQGSVTATQILELQMSNELGGFTMIGSGGTATYTIQKLRLPHACNDATGITTLGPYNVAVPYMKNPVQLRKPPPAPIEDIYMLFGELAATENFTHHAEDSNGNCEPVPFFGAYLLQTWRTLHEDEFILFGDNLMGFQITKWEMPKGQLYARKTIDRSVTQNEVTFSEVTTFDLFHRPRS